MKIFEEERSVLNGIESENIYNNYRLFVNPDVRFPVSNIVNDNPFLSSCIFRKSQLIRLGLVCD
jgi:hypothetical protein